MPQTAMTLNPAIGQEGTFANSFGNRTISRVAEETIHPGACVVVTADDDSTCELPDATGEITGGRVLGIAMLDHKRTTANYSAGDTVTIMVEGEIWVTTEDSSTAGEARFSKSISIAD